MREIVHDRTHPSNGRVLLVRDPHDGSQKDRWFVEMQIRFDDEESARACFDTMTRIMNRDDGAVR